MNLYSVGYFLVLVVWEVGIYFWILVMLVEILILLIYFMVSSWMLGKKMKLIFWMIIYGIGFLRK